MIAEAMADLIAVFVMVITSPLPSGGIVLPSFGPAVGLGQLFDGVLPVHETFEMALLILQVTVVIFGFRLIMWMYSIIPFKGT